MKKIIIAAILIIAALAATACAPMAIVAEADGAAALQKPTASQGPESPGPGGSGDTPTDYNAQYEALDWLSQNDSVSALAGNRFYTTGEAIDFVKSLYSAGADTVWVTGIVEEASPDGEKSGPYADTLIVKLPEDTARQDKIKAIYQREVQTFGCNEGDEASGCQGDLLYLFWDKDTQK
jgi:hypothetical protein